MTDLVRAHEALRDHLKAFFDGHDTDCVGGVPGPIERAIPGFRIFRVGPGPRFPGWAYVSSGCWSVTADEQDGHGLEFVLMAYENDRQHLETITMNAYYHAGLPHHRLGHGHVVPIGRPWFRDSACDRCLVSSPYPFGHDFEVCSWDQGHARILWLLPITPAERDVWRDQGMEALETLFDQAGIDFANPGRPSVV
jgi:hypothetical protein